MAFTNYLPYDVTVVVELHIFIVNVNSDQLRYYRSDEDYREIKEKDRNSSQIVP